MIVYGDKGLEILFPKCRYTNDINEAQVVFLTSTEQYVLTEVLQNDSPYILQSSAYASLNKAKTTVIVNRDLTVKLKTVQSQMNPKQLLVVCGGYAGAYAKSQNLTIGRTSRDSLASYIICLNGYKYHVIGNQASVILAKVDNNATILAKSQTHLSGFLKGFDLATYDGYGEAEIIYFKHEDQPNCLLFQFFPDFYPKATIVPKLASRIKNYI